MDEITILTKDVALTDQERQQWDVFLTGLKTAHAAGLITDETVTDIIETLSEDVGDTIENRIRVILSMSNNPISL